MKLLVIIMIFLFQENVQCKDATAIQFIKSYVQNEENSKFVICYDLCWKKSAKLKLLRELIKADYRFSTTLTAHFTYQIQTFLLDLDCSDSEEHLLNASTQDLFTFPNRWLIISSHRDDTLKKLWNLPLFINTEIVLAERKDNRFIVSELYKTSPLGPTYAKTQGFYNGSYFDTRIYKELFHRRKDIMGHQLTMSIVIQDSNTTQNHLEDRLEPQHDSIAKISWMIVKLAFEMLNATPQYIFSHRYGYKQDGHWSGMIDDIHKGRAELGTNCAVNAERLSVIQYTDTIAPFKVAFIFRQPPLSYVSNVFSLPFSIQVWMAVASCAIFSIVALFLANKWEALFQRGHSQLDGTITEAMLITMSALSQQGCTIEPRKLSGRIVVWVVFTTLMALYAAYAANIVVLLQAPSSAIRTLEQLARSKLTLTANDVDYNYFVFGMFSDPLRVDITKKVKSEKNNSHFYEINKGVEKIRQGLFAFHSIVEPIYRRVEQTFLETEKCDLEEIDFMTGFDPTVPVKKHSPYLELLKISFKKIRESGLQSALNKRLQIPKPRCSHRVSSFSSIGLIDLRPVLELMIFGITISVVILIIEIVKYNL